MAVHAGYRAAQYVAQSVAAGLQRGQAHIVEALPDAGHVFHADPVQLNRLARGDIGVLGPENRALGAVRSFAEGVGRHTDGPELGCSEKAAGNLDAQHEGVAALLLRIDPGPLQPLDLSGDGGDGPGPLLRVPIEDGPDDLVRMALELLLFDQAQLADRPVGVDELHRPLIAPELHPIEVVLVPCHQVCSPHSTLSVPDQRPARGSSPSATGRVVGAQPMDRYPCDSNGWRGML